MTSTPLNPASTVATPRQRWLVLGVACIAQLMVVLDATVVNIALPSAQHALGFSDASRQWIVSGYALAFGSLLLLGGRLGGRLGYRRAFLIGMIGFAAASALGGASVSVGMLIVARVLQGAFGALLSPAALSLITTTFPGGSERSRAFGVYGAVASAGGGIGLLLGGVLTEHLSWRWCLYINIIFAVVAVVGAVVTIREPERDGHGPGIDVPGAVLVTGGLFAVVLGLGNAASRGWGDLLTWGPLVVGALLIVGFVLVQRRSPHPLLPLRVLRDRDRMGSYVAMLTSSVAIFGLFLFLTYYLQETLGFSAVQNGLAYLPMIVMTTVGSTFLAGRLLGRFGPKVVLPAGMLIVAGSLILLTGLGSDSSYLTGVLPALLLVGLGFGLTITPAINLGTARIDGPDAGAASALVNTTQQVGGSIGLAVLGTVFASVAAGSAGGHAAAALAGYAATYLWSAVIVAAGAVIVAALLRGRQAAEPSATRPVAPGSTTSPPAVPVPSPQPRP